MAKNSDKRKQPWSDERRARHSRVLKQYHAEKKALRSSQSAVKDTPKAITPADNDVYSVGFIGRLLAWAGFSR